MTKISRREAVRQLAALVLGAEAGLLSACGEATPENTLGPWPCRPSHGSMSLFFHGPVSPGPALVRDAHGVVVAEASFETFARDVHLARVSGLAPDTEYAFEVETREILRTGSFRTLPTATGFLRVAIGADIHAGSAPFPAFDRIAERAPHFFLGLGDHAYADLHLGGGVAPTRVAYETLYRDTWSDPSLARCWSHVPSVLVWDDHETWNDFDGTSSPERIAAARDVYLRLQRSRADGADDWFVIDAGPASFFVADTRSHRSPNASLDGPEKSMLGLEQRQALFDWLATSTAKVRVFATPTPLHAYADTGLDSWAHGFSTERALILDRIDQSAPESVVVVSGDLHWPSVVRLELPSGASILELGCTPTAAFTRPSPAPAALGADALYVGSDVRGFGELEIDGDGDAVTASFRFIDERGEEQFFIELLGP